MGAAVASFYAGAVEIQWQLFILVIFLFTGILGFFWVLFDETTTEIPRSVNVQDNGNENVTYQSSLEE